MAPSTAPPPSFTLTAAVDCYGKVRRLKTEMEENAERPLNYHTQIIFIVLNMCFKYEDHFKDEKRRPWRALQAFHLGTTSSDSQFCSELK